MSESRKERKKRERKERKERREREKALKLAQMMKKRDDEEKELYEPKIITEKGYKLDNLGELGLGALSIVYKICKEENKQEKFVAAKVIDLEQFEDTFKIRFIERHLSILKLVSAKHDCIVPVYDIFQTVKRVYIMMELAVNGTVADYINNKGPVLESQAKKWSVCILRGINYLHTNSVAHRNIRTEHLLLDQNLNVKLTGFSFSRPFINPQSDKLELSETNCGLGPYFAPEVICGEAYNPKVADLWSIGAVIFMMLNKKYPFDYKNVFIQMNQQEGSEWRKKFKITPTEECVDFLSKFFEISPAKRTTARSALDLPWLNIPENAAGKRDEKDDIREEIKRLYQDNQEQLVQALSRSVEST